MTTQEPGWSPDTLRAFKEILYRFMGEMHATKAALYLRTGNAMWKLASRYGFGRRDQLDPVFEDDHTLVRMVRAFGDGPRYYNDAAELGEIAPYLRAAGTDRLLLVPLRGSPGLIGFVDVRDKGGRRPFEVSDLELARTIAVALAGRVEGKLETGQTSEPSVEPAPAEPDRAGSPDDGPKALLDDLAFDEVVTAAAAALIDPRVLAVAVSAVDGASAGVLVQQRGGAPAVELDPLIRHQLEAMERAALAAPPRASWRTELRRVPGSAVAVSTRPVVATAVVLRGGRCSLVATVVADTDPVLARRSLERLAVRATAAAERFRLRVANRGLARRLLQPGNRRYPELVAHSLGVSRLCWSVARALGLDEHAIEQAALAGLLHDVGMRELDYDRLYLHPTPGPEDRRTYRLHVEVGERIVRVEGMDEIADAVRYHHERWDGNGYPDRLAGDAIPLLARIVHAAEVFDLFTAANSYRPAVSRERALAILERAAGHQFDATVVDALAKVVS